MVVMKTLINPYRSEFKRIFGLRKKEIQKCLGGNLRIEHFGSTAVPGLPGKGVVDILIGFPSKTQLRRATQKLAAMGYFLSRKSRAMPGKRIFLSSTRRESGTRDIHVHLVLENSADFDRVLYFRNRLRRNKVLRAAYLEIKKRAAMAAAGKRARYTALKSEFIEKASAGVMG